MSAALSTDIPVPNLGRVLVADGVVYVRDLEEHDAEVVRVVSESEDPATATSQCLRIGARAMRAAHVTVDVDVIERSFADLETRFASRVSAAVDEIADTTSGLLDAEDGALTGALGAFRGDIDQLLGDTFDADSKVSVLTKIEELVLGTMKGLITPEIADSPIGRLKAELIETVERQVSDVAEGVRRVHEHLGVTDAVAEVYERTTGKGFDYEDLVDECVGTLAAGYGDLAVCTAKESGCNGSDVGDETVTLNRDDTCGIEACFTLEVKNRCLNLRATMSELDEALTNRDALAAIAVFRSQDQAPTSVAFQYSDDKAIVVYDPDDGDDSALRLAYMWARWTVRRRLSVNEHDELDLEHIARLLDDAGRALERHTAIKRFHTQAKNNINQAAAQVKDLVGETRQAIDDLEAALGSEA